MIFCRLAIVSDVLPNFSWMTVICMYVWNVGFGVMARDSDLGSAHLFCYLTLANSCILILKSQFIYLYLFIISSVQFSHSVMSDSL